MANAFTFGIEEEYLLVDAETKLVAHDMPQAFFEAARAASDGRVSPEFLQPQIEVISSPHTDMAAGRAELRHLRRTVAAVAAEHGGAILASGTHPTALWRSAQQTAKRRYDTVMHDLQMIGQRDLLCGLHVHVAFPDPDERFDVMTGCCPTCRWSWSCRRPRRSGHRARPASRATGSPPLTSCRVPGSLSCSARARSRAYVAALVRAGVMKDSSISGGRCAPRSTIRPWNCGHPIPARWSRTRSPSPGSYRTVAHHLYFNRWRNSELNPVTRAIVVENKWRAQRYGVHGPFVTEEGAVTVAEMLDRVAEETAKEPRHSAAPPRSGAAAPSSVRGPRPTRSSRCSRRTTAAEPRRGAARGHRLDRRRHAAVRASVTFLPFGPVHQAALSAKSGSRLRIKLGFGSPPRAGGRCSKGRAMRSSWHGPRPAINGRFARSWHAIWAAPSGSRWRSSAAPPRPTI